MAYGVLPGGCPYNEGVACSNPDKCGSCGWNEEVAAQRTAQIMEDLGMETKEK